MSADKIKDKAIIIKGICHIHSSHSFDSELSLDQIKKLCNKRNYQFALLTEHTDTLNSQRYKEYMDICRDQSDSNVILVPGLEFSCKSDIHILGINIDQYFVEVEPHKTIQKIHELGGLAILAHPSRYNNKLPILQLKRLDGIEIWNTNYNGTFAPRLSQIILLEQLQQMNKNMYGYTGLDLHYELQPQGPLLQVKADELSCSSIISSLKQGKFSIESKLVDIPSSSKLPIYTKVYLEVISFFNLITLQFISFSKTILDKLGISAPYVVRKLIHKLGL